MNQNMERVRHQLWVLPILLLAFWLCPSRTLSSWVWVPPVPVVDSSCFCLSLLLFNTFVPVITTNNCCNVSASLRSTIKHGMQSSRVGKHVSNSNHNSSECSLVQVGSLFFHATEDAPVSVEDNRLGEASLCALETVADKTRRTAATRQVSPCTCGRPQRREMFRTAQT